MLLLLLQVGCDQQGPHTRSVSCAVGQPASGYSHEAAVIRLHLICLRAMLAAYALLLLLLLVVVGCHQQGPNTRSVSCAVGQPALRLLPLGSSHTAAPDLCTHDACYLCIAAAAAGGL
jgi:hypothetical protein